MNYCLRLLVVFAGSIRGNAYWASSLEINKLSNITEVGLAISFQPVVQRDI